MKKIKNVLITGVFFMCTSPILASLPSSSRLYFADNINDNVKQDCTKAQNNKLMAKAQSELVTTAFEFLEGDIALESGESFAYNEMNTPRCKHLPEYTACVINATAQAELLYIGCYAASTVINIGALACFGLVAAYQATQIYLCKKQWCD